MMTVKEYVEGKVKSYTRLAERCRLEAEASDDIVVRAGYSARANVWEMCAEEMDNVREMLQEIWGDHVCLTLSTMSCGTPCTMQKLAICLHPVHLICAPGGLDIKAQTVLHPRFIIAARKRESRTSIPFFKKS